MNTKFEKYLNDIGIIDDLKGRVEEIILFYEIIYDDKADDIFVTDMINDDGSRVYNNLWLFYTDKIMEAKNFISSENYDCLFRKIERLKHWAIEKSNYDFVKANDKSRLNFKFSCPTMGGEFRAAKNNCDYFKEIMLKYFKE